MKKIAVLYYSQTGQTLDLIKSVLSKIPPSVQVDYYPIEPKKPYPFPWSKDEFLSVMPECVLEKPTCALKPLESKEPSYDLIVLGYQPWFLSISAPVLSFLKSPLAQDLFKDTPVLSLITCRNMWARAHDSMIKLLTELKAKPCGVITLDDDHSNIVSFITIMRWMLFGKKKGGIILPDAGVGDKEIEKAERFGALISDHLEKGSLGELERSLKKLHNTPDRPELVVFEKKAYARFKLFARFVEPSTGLSRKRKLRAFMYLVFTVSFITFPLVAIIEGVMSLKRYIKRSRRP